MKYKAFLMVFILALGLNNIALAKSKTTKTPAPAERIRVMTYNVENLFDTQDDPKIDDETYLPRKLKKDNPEITMRCQRLEKDWYREQCMKTDWNEKLLKRKMQRLADVIRKASHRKGLDVLIVQEVENQAILERLRKEYLSDLFTQPAILIDGPDSRGIDVGILTRLESKSAPKLHTLKFVANEQLPQDQIRNTRGILEAELKLPDGQSLFVFGVHFPSQGAPTEVRKQALAQLEALMDTKPKDSFIIAGGDFNITRSEDAKQSYFYGLNKNYLVSHFNGCKGCRGTNYYHTLRSWSFFDVLAFSKNFASKDSAWQLDKSSIHIPNKSLYQVNRYGSPSRFNNGRGKDGVSDHWPMMAEIYKNPAVLTQTISAIKETDKKINGEPAKKSAKAKENSKVN